MMHESCNFIEMFCIEGLLLGQQGKTTAYWSEKFICIVISSTYLTKSDFHGMIEIW